VVGDARLRVLLFEDEPLLRGLLETLLTGRGYDVVSFAEPLHCPVYERGGSCSCPAGQACGDILLTDVEMPRVSGIEMIADQQAAGCRADARNVAIMSAGWTPERKQLARSLGCETFDKPFRIADLNRWLDECEQRVDRGRQLRSLE
jgi:CheY-like chemotaxis protein